MHRLVRIEGLHDFRVSNTLKFVLYDGSKYITLEGEIRGDNYILFTEHQNDTSKLFKGFGITNDAAKLEYCKKQDPKCLNGVFPVHSSLTALKETLLSFFDLNTDIKIPPKYNIGDKVVIRSYYHSNSKASDYCCGFMSDMLKLGGKTVTIKSIHNLNPPRPQYKHYYEPYRYDVVENNWDWSSEMFEDSVISEDNKVVDSKIQIKEILSSRSKGFNVIFTNGNSIHLSVQGSGFLSGHNQIFKTCDRAIDDLSSFLNEELDCVRDTSGYEPYINKEENIWIFIDDLKYRFGTEECKKTINPEFYKHLKKKPKQGIIEQIEYSQTKTQGNAHQFCKRRGTVCRGNVPEGNRICGKRSKASVSSRPLGYREVIGY